MPVVLGQIVGPTASTLAVLAGVAAGQTLPPSGCAPLAGWLWVTGVVLLLAELANRPGFSAGAWVALLTGYAVLVFMLQPSLRADGNAAAGVRASAA
jgi:hypothetical protein